MSFAFNFGGDDINDENEPLAAADQSMTDVEQRDNAESAPVVPVVRHNVKEWLALLPSQISYTTHDLTSPLGRTTQIHRRAIFDIRAQLMAEDDDDDPSHAHASAPADAASTSSLLSALATSDLTRSVHEGGFKTWECSLDLARLLLDRGPRKDIDEMSRVARVVELGCGTAVPSLVLFTHVLRQSCPVPNQGGGSDGASHAGIEFALADYNADVLRLVTLPNLLLNWALMADVPAGREDGQGSSGAGELDVTPEVVEGFLAAMGHAGIELSLISGPWGDELLQALPGSVPDMTTLVLAAETIYSPESLQGFVDLLYGLLRQERMNKAYVAAKRFYFGVGGSVDALKVACRDRAMVAAEVENSGLTDMDEGVGRAVVEVQLF